jgi:CelD/BcsL family acetyltransferase involved in cellulose biosynthesis
MQVQAVTTYSEFVAMREDWERLMERAPAANIFLTHDWVATWWRHYGNGSRLNILAVYRGKELVGLAPLMIQQRRLVGFPVLRRVAFIGTGVSDRLDILLAPGHERATLAAMVSRLQHQRWDIVDLQEIPEGSTTAKLLPELAEAARTPAEVTVQSICPVIQLPSEPGAYFASLSSKFRKNLSWYERRLRKEHTLSVDFLDNGPRLEQDLQAFFRLYRKSFSDRPSAREVIGDEFAALRQEVATRFAMQGSFQLALLRVDGHEVAGELSFLYRRTFYAYNSCHDPAWKRGSVGSILRGQVIRRAIVTGCQEYDFLRGEEPYKYTWGATSRRHVGIRMIRESSKLRLVLDGARLLRSSLPRGVTDRLATLLKS